MPPNNFSLIFMGMKQQKLEIVELMNWWISEFRFFFQNLELFLTNFQGLILSLVGLIDAKGMYVAQPLVEPHPCLSHESILPTQGSIL